MQLRQSSPNYSIGCWNLDISPFVWDSRACSIHSWLQVVRRCSHTFSEWNETSVGVGLAVIGVTLMGLFAMMVGLILYIMGKQVKQIQAQYNHWPKDE